jgi:hypothetical protein
LITKVKQHNRYRLTSLVNENGLTLEAVRPFHVAAYIEQMPGWSREDAKKLLESIPRGDFIKAGATILEKIERAASCCRCAVFLFTKDDELDTNAKGNASFDAGSA